jgi:hypothetical protein
MGSGKTAGRWMRHAAACALALAAFAAHAAPAPGTNIQNQATATGLAGAIPVSGTSNVVNLTVGAPPPPYTPPPSLNATLTPNNFAIAQPGATVYLGHLLTNTSATPDTSFCAAESTPSRKSVPTRQARTATVNP